MVGRQKHDETALPKRSALSEALGACRAHFAFVLVFSASLNLLYLAPSLYMMQVYDRVLVTGGIMTLVFLSLVLLTCLAALAFLDATRARLLAAASRRLDRLLAPLILAAPFGRARAHGERPVLALREFDVLRGTLTGPASLALCDAPWTPLYIGVCFIVHPWLGAVATCGGAALIAVATLNEASLRHALRGSEDAGAAMYTLQQADSAHAGVARALGMHHGLMGRQVEARTDFAEAQGRAAHNAASYMASSKFLRLTLQSASLGVGALLAVRQEISAGALIACSILTARAFAPLEQLVGAWRGFAQAAHALGVVRSALEAAPDRLFTQLPAVKGALSVDFASVISSRGDRSLIQGVSFRVQPGEILGVIGPSGAGKSTLMSAIVGAIALHDGVIRLDGAQLADWPPEALGRFIGYLPQHVALFTGSLAQNICRFEPRDPQGEVDCEIMAAAQKAGVHELILRLPHGYDTQIGPDGMGLSAGQAQRIALARALYREPTLIVLDEPNAHMDAEGEGALVNALKFEQARGAAIVVVAHRAGLMRIADTLMFLREGRMEALGPRDAVMTTLGAVGSVRPIGAAQVSGQRDQR